jgi:hypothetical protein
LVMKRVTGIGGIIDPEGNKVELWHPPPGR